MDEFYCCLGSIPYGVPSSCLCAPVGAVGVRFGIEIAAESVCVGRRLGSRDLWTGDTHALRQTRRYAFMFKHLYTCARRETRICLDAQADTHI